MAKQFGWAVLEQPQPGQGQEPPMRQVAVSGVAEAQGLLSVAVRLVLGLLVERMEQQEPNQRRASVQK